MSVHAIKNNKKQSAIKFCAITTIDQLIAGLTPEQRIREICFNVSCWTSQLRVVERVPRKGLSLMDRLSSNYQSGYHAQRCDLIGEAMMRLGAICINSNLHPSLCAFWDGVDSFRKTMFQSVLDSRGKLTDQSSTLKMFIEALCNGNHIIVNGYFLYPDALYYFCGYDHGGHDDNPWRLTKPNGEEKYLRRLLPTDIMSLYKDIFDRDAKGEVNKKTAEMLNNFLTLEELRWNQGVILCEEDDLHTAEWA